VRQNNLLALNITMSRHEELGDALNAGRVASDAAHNYYSFMLLKEKLKAQGVAEDSPLFARVVGARSEKEALELHILAVIQGEGYGESSANFSQLVDLTGTRDKISMAKFLAEKVYEREATKMILNRFAPNPRIAQNEDPVSRQPLFGFQALINSPRGEAAVGAAGTREASVAARALGALTGIRVAAGGSLTLPGGAEGAGLFPA